MGLHIVGGCLLCANPAVNPFVYGVCNKKFRNAYIQILLCQKSRTRRRAQFVESMRKSVNINVVQINPRNEASVVSMDYGRTNRISQISLNMQSIMPERRSMSLIEKNSPNPSVSVEPNSESGENVLEERRFNSLC